ncbi:unnamed protein product, partial [Rangifer tarandus platyrhynchus]
MPPGACGLLQVPREKGQARGGGRPGASGPGRQPRGQLPTQPVVTAEHLRPSVGVRRWAVPREGRCRLADPRVRRACGRRALETETLTPGSPLSPGLAWQDPGQLPRGEGTQGCPGPPRPPGPIRTGCRASSWPPGLSTRGHCERLVSCPAAPEATGSRAHGLHSG